MFEGSAQPHISITSPDVENTFRSYPQDIRDKLFFLRELIFETAKEIGIEKELEETLKWGEPSYLHKNGSTIRIAWRTSQANQYAIYFHCKTTLVETFKELYPAFTFENNRAIVFDRDDPIPVNELKHCIELSLNYHRIKHLPMLGV